MKKILASIFTVLLAFSITAQSYSWQEPHAKVLPKGDLEWSPEPFAFEKGGSVRYIDFENGDDNADGKSKDSAWKHHPWDKNASGVSAKCTGIHTYVFKNGVTYRGMLKGTPGGEADNPVRLTSEPDWGDGHAVLAGSERLGGGWKSVAAADAPQGLPDPEKVWQLKLGRGPRPWCLWQADENGGIKRLPLARAPNWKVDEGQMDVMADWWQWSWGKGNITKVKRKTGGRTVDIHACVDRKNLTLPKDAYMQAYVWSEWGPVMGTPCAREVVDFEPEKNRLFFPGFWGGGGRNVYGGNRYYLENSPYFLDEDGEWWFDSKSNTLYLRMAEDPAQAGLELARESVLIDLVGKVRNISISGLTFRFTNVHTPHRRFADQAVIRCLGSADGINIHHCTFEHVNVAARIKASGSDDFVENVRFTDNRIRYTDYGAVFVKDGMGWGKTTQKIGQLGDVKILRNKMDHLGMRPGRSDNGHALQVSFPDTAEIAGNIMDRCYGSGIFVFGAKASGYLGDAPLSRILIHHNKVTNGLLRSNDWGNIETWQGGPHYVFNNVSGNPWGYWNWNKRHFGFAYYMDGSFKNYQFNNIAWGTSSEAKPHGNTSAFQEIISYQNFVFNNSVFRFVVGSRRQAPQAGRDLFAGNIWEDIGEWVLWHARPAKSADEANQMDVGKVGKEFVYGTMAYARNLFVGKPENIGVFEANGMPHMSAESMREALRKRGARGAQLGKTVDSSPYMDAEAHDFRLKPGSPAIDYGVRVFVPWALCAMVGEWNFARNNADPSELIDDHWYMTSAYKGRQDYYKVPTFPLEGVNIGADDFVSGPLENWTPAGALKLNGRDQYAVLDLGGSDEKEADAEKKEPGTEEYKPADWLSVTAPEKIVPGTKFEAVLSLNGVAEGKQLEAHLHWAKKDAWGGFNAIGMPLKQEVGAGKSYTFTFKPVEKQGLARFSILVFAGPGGFGNKEMEASVTIPAGEKPGPAIEKLKSPAIDRSNFLIEAYLKLEGDSGLIMRKMDGGAGYDLSVKDGRPVLKATGSGQSGTVSGPSPLNDGKFHHVLAECDRESKTLIMYIDGREAARAPGVGKDASLDNSAPVYVGGTPEGENLAATLEFLRISRGTLADASTDIGELYSWQFDGPQMRDFRGNPRGDKPDAGALQAEK